MANKIKNLKSIFNNTLFPLQKEDTVFVTHSRRRTYHGNGLCGHLRTADKILKKKYRYMLHNGYKRHC